MSRDVRRLQYRYVVCLDLSIVEFLVICRSVDDVGWLVKVHHEAVMKQTMAAEKFPSYMCGEIKQCVKLEDLNKPMEQEIDAPFW